MVESGAFSLAASATRDISSVLTNTFKSAWEVKKQTSSTPATIESAERLAASPPLTNHRRKTIIIVNERAGGRSLTIGERSVMHLLKRALNFNVRY